MTTYAHPPPLERMKSSPLAYSSAPASPERDSWSVCSANILPPRRGLIPFHPLPWLALQCKLEVGSALSFVDDDADAPTPLLNLGGKKKVGGAGVTVAVNFCRST